MTIQEAIESGKPFKRPIYNGWIYLIGNIFLWDELYGNTTGYVADKQDILADDWEVKQ